MASGPTIIASIGADTAPLKRDLANAESQVERSMSRMQREQQKAYKKLGSSIGGESFGLMQDVGAAFGLGTGIIGAITLLIPKVLEIKEAMEDARDARDKLLGQIPTNSSDEDLLQRLEKTNKELKEMTRQVGFFEGIGKAATGAFSMMGGNPEPLTRFMQGGGRGDNDILLKRKEELSQMIEANKKNEQMRKEINQADADAQKQGMERRKALSELAAKDAAEAIKNINQEKSAEIELGNVRSQQDDDRYQAEQRFQDLAEKGREKMIDDIHKEEAERKKMAENIGKAFKDAEESEMQRLHDRFIEGELGGADFRRERGRKERKERRAEEKWGRLKRLAERGGHAIADVPEIPPQVGPANPVKREATLDVTNNLLGEVLKRMEGWVKSQ